MGIKENHIMINYKIEVKGKVYLVGYRYTAYQKINTLGIKGNVQNLEDVSVVINVFAQPAKMEPTDNW